MLDTRRRLGTSLSMWSHSVPTCWWVQVLSQTAVAYFRAGLGEQGRNILDSVLRSYPTRLDLWNLYADQV